MAERDFRDDAEERLVEDLRCLAEGPPPPERVARRLVAELRAQGLLKPGGIWRRRLLAGAAAALLFASGIVAGRGVQGPGPAAPSAPPAPRYALFLLGGVEPSPDEAALVEEYRSWARDLARAGLLSSGHKLDATAWLLHGSDSEADVLTPPAAHRAAPLSGFFLLTTEDPREALEIARSCPHLRHGGEVLLRPIEPT